ncbi:MAG TPA: hypothetical protein VFO36_05245, partial [Nitrospiraceae bacterium]|nr:hypothetical protein [Nitrospiraceae bacterium]
VHEGHVIVQLLEDGAIRFVQPNGECIESHMRLTGDWRELPAVDHLAARRVGMEFDGYGIALDSMMSLPRGASAET